jgi:hypothetical protein
MGKSHGISLISLKKVGNFSTHSYIEKVETRPLTVNYLL